jgi:hypothetical protein
MTQVTAIHRRAALRAPVRVFDRINVDAENGILKNVNLMQEGSATGHNFDIDSTTIQQLVALVNAAPNGVKTRFKHPEETRDAEGNPVSLADALGTQIGFVKNARVDGNCARGEIYLGSYAAILPGLGNVRLVAFRA